MKPLKEGLLMEFKDSKNLKDMIDIFEKFEGLNQDIYNHILNGDFELIDSTVNSPEYMEIRDSEFFNKALSFYRLSNLSFTIDGRYLGNGAYNHDLEEFAKSHLSISFHEFKQTFTKDIYTCLALMDMGYERHQLVEPLQPKRPYMKMSDDEKLERKKRRLNEYYSELIFEYIKAMNGLFANKIDEESPSKESTNPKKDRKKEGVPSKEASKYNYWDEYQGFYINQIIDLARRRSVIYNVCEILPIGRQSKIDNDELADKKTLKEKLDYLKGLALEDDDNIYDDYDYYLNRELTKRTPKVLFSNYLQGKYIDRKTWFAYKNHHTFQNNIKFFLELAFYLALPTSNAIEEFLNLNGLSIKHNMRFFYDLSFKGKTYPISYPKLCKWIDAGIDYDLLNQMIGLEFQIKDESRLTDREGKRTSTDDAIPFSITPNGAY
jgi:hypothetical protein